MAVSAIRCTLEFAEDSQGFTETYYLNTTSFDVATPAFLRLCKARANLCGPPVRFREGRMTLVTAGKASRTYLLLDNVAVQSVAVPTKKISTIFSGMQDNNAEFCRASIQCTLSSGPAHHRLLYMAGCPDVLFGMNPQLVPNFIAPTWQTDFNNFRNELLNGAAWGYAGKLKPQEALGPIVRGVLSAQNRLGDGLLGLTYTPGGLALGVNDTTAVHGFLMNNPAYAGPNGTWKVESTVVDSPVAGQNTTYLRNSQGVTAANIATFGSVENVVIVFLKFDDILITNQVARKRGNRFLSTPGRRTTRRKL